jgi:hypothetical protein
MISAVFFTHLRVKSVKAVAARVCGTVKKLYISFKDDHFFTAGWKRVVVVEIRI